LREDHGDGAAAGRPRLGALLLARGAVSPDRLAAALARQPETGARLGDILARRGWAASREIAAAAAEQAGAARVDLAAAPPDPSLADPAWLDVCLRRRALPWRRLGGRIILVAADHAAGRAAVADLGLPDATVALVEPDALDRAIAEAYGPALAARAAARPPAALSARSPAPAWQKGGLLAALIATGAALAAAPTEAGALLFALLVALNALNAAARIAALASALRPDADPVAPPPAGAVDLAARRPPPRIALLVPLLREPEALPLLLEALERLDWPPELLDVVLVLEPDDAATRAAIDRLEPPPFVRVLIAPPGGPRTKPRALNLALDFAQGDIIGIYDAEDRPEPDQLRRVAEILRAAPPEVAAVQCRLSYFNAGENWLTRCFTIEYAIWFDVLLKGFRDLGLPIPLGGTSVFFRRAALERLGGWDAHNVTEDADLGMRLARTGYRCETCASTTYEEASSRLGPWIRQRSRWLKGYVATWLVHMRRPAALWRALGPLGFLGFQTIFLGAIVAYFGLPLFWTVWGATLLGAGPSWLAAAPLWALGALALVQLSGWIAMIIAATIATARRRQLWLLPWTPTLAFYWPIGAVAAWLALAEFAVAPFHWRKTRHGVGRIARAERDAALARRDAARRGEATDRAAE
jgi:cellulose synthase/poly-beta-1,6-N-acetylglucosamine synthase-like glycosyltransferase